ncbi:CBS domain-containing protein [Kitasatospora cathayae]|uniref:CBS domain-containing protein n=1 Tax=Kitasatospora cathayae TaxID=3004092 RepID=UPI00386012B7
MTRNMVVAHRETTFKEIAGLFHRHGISAVPVVDERHRPGRALRFARPGGPRRPRGWSGADSRPRRSGTPPVRTAARRG